ncbi:MAG TPA: hypothetical protein VMR49_00880 [Candidatus Paceibacterota bacterium]|jgi:hypothetical protein|nr:hypothetical protein [Candidatus Paceibacterota bacterium]
MESKDFIPLVEDPNTLNYAVSIAAFNLNEDPKILLVKYQNEFEKPSKRLPAGKFRVADLLLAINSFLEQNDDHRDLVFLTYEAENLNKGYEFLDKSTQDQDLRNRYFNEFTAELHKKLQNCKSLKTEEFKEILKNTHLNTVKHELREETDASKMGNFYISSAPSDSKGHHKIGFTSVEVEAPIYYKSLTDPKVLESFWEYIDEHTASSLFNGHQSKFQEGLAQTIRLGFHPNAFKLNKFLTANK